MNVIAASSQTLAQASNGFVYASMLVFTLAFFAFAGYFAGSRTSAAPARGREEALDAAQRQAAQAVAARSHATVGAGPAVDDVPADGAGAPVVVTGSATGFGDSGPEVPERSQRWANIGLSLTWLATALLAAGVVLRGVSAGRVPWGNMYEFSITAALAVALVYAVLSMRHDLRFLGIFVTGAVLLTLGLAVTVLYTESAQLVPALKSWWLAIHVSAAVICAGAFTVGAALTVLYLWRDRVERRTPPGQPITGFASRLPSAERLDTLAYRVNAFVFPLWTFAVIAGAIWAENAWGRYWGWDPKETWAFITWGIYAGYLHARATAGWKGRRAAIICLIGFASFIFNYFVVNLLVTGLHSYAGV